MLEGNPEPRDSQNGHEEVMETTGLHHTWIFGSEQFWKVLAGCGH